MEQEDGKGGQRPTLTLLLPELCCWLIEDTEVTEPKWNFRVDLAPMCSDGSEWAESGVKESS